MSVLSLRPHAKINLGLRILGPRSDGYHELRTRFQTIDLTDELHLAWAPEELRLDVEGAALPGDAANLVLRAAQALREVRPGLPGATIRLRKHIPLAAGLGGGSSDAAAALLGLNRLWQVGLPREELKRIGSSLGADVGFFLVGGSALGVGRGDEVIPLPDGPSFRIALVLPPLASSTAEIYRLWDERSRHAGPRKGSPQGFDPEGDPLEEPSSRSVHNDLEEIVVSAHPHLAVLRQTLIENGALAAALSGSGPSLYGLFLTREEVRRLQSAHPWGPVRVLDCSPVGRVDYWERLGLPLSD